MIIDDASGQTLAEGWNRTEELPTAHDVTDAIARLSAGDLGRASALTVVCTAEPCPMCASAIVWTGIGRVVYGTSSNTLRARGKLGIDIGLDEVVRRSFRERAIEHIGGVLEAECDLLYSD
ncbi:MAG: deaminase [Chloroflexota bacterium]|nr:deaminase [Chloroflexota bacterium]